MRSGSPFGSYGSRGRSSSRVALTTGALSLAIVLLAAAAARMVEGARPGPLPRVVPRLVPAGIRFFTDPQSSSAAWTGAHPRDRRAALISRRITSQPQAVWLTGRDPLSVQDEVQLAGTEAATRHELPILVMYDIPHRDCAQSSSGGAPNGTDYRRWVDGVSTGLGSLPAWIIVEPDALMQVSCLAVPLRTERLRLLRYAARTLHEHNPSARIYYDAGHSSWHSAGETARLLRRAGVNGYGDGIALNVANFNATGDEVRFGLEVIGYLQNPELRMVIDTSRNGSGKYVRYGTCDPPGSRLGTPPTSRTGDPWVDGFLWVKPPGQSDGCDGSPGAFLPDEAYRLAERPTTRFWSLHRHPGFWRPTTNAHRDGGRPDIHAHPSVNVMQDQGPRDTRNEEDDTR